MRHDTDHTLRRELGFEIAVKKQATAYVLDFRRPQSDAIHTQH